MDPLNSFPGYGYSFDGCEAAWSEITRDMPEDGPDCPLVLDLLEYSRGLLPEQTADGVKRHLADCFACQERLASMTRAAEQLAKQFSENRPTLAEQVASSFAEQEERLLSGVPEMVSTGAITTREVEQRCRLRPAHGDHLLLCLLLNWARQGGSGEPERWRLTVRVPSNQVNPTFGNGEELLAALDGRVLRLSLLVTGHDRVRCIETRLVRDLRRELVSAPEQPGPEAIPDPLRVQRVEWLMEGSLPEPIFAAPTPTQVILEPSRPLWQRRFVASALAVAALAAAVLIAFTIWSGWSKQEMPDTGAETQVARAESRVESAKLLPDAVRAMTVNLLTERRPTIRNLPYKLEFVVSTRWSRGSLYQISQHGITPLGSFQRQGNGFMSGLCAVQFGEQPGHAYFVLVLVDKDAKASHFAKSLGGILNDEEREELVEAANRPGVEAIARKVIGSALREKDCQADVLVVGSIEHTDS